MSSYENEAPAGEGITDNEYTSRPGAKSEPIGVVSDQERIDEPTAKGDQDTDEQLGLSSLVSLFLSSIHRRCGVNTFVDVSADRGGIGTQRGTRQRPLTRTISSRSARVALQRSRAPMLSPVMRRVFLVQMTVLALAHSDFDSLLT